MAISHICQECGTDLAHVRVAIDPHYQLPLVTCPTCGRHCVRRRHPLISGFRRLRKMDWSLTVLAGQILSALTLIGASHSIPMGIGSIVHGGMDFGTEGFLALCVFVFVCLPIVTGIWLTAALPHWSRWRAWLTWFIVVAMTMITTMSLAAIAMPDRAFNGDSAGAMHRVITMNATVITPSLVVYMVVLGLATIAFPIGRGVRRAHAQWRSWRWTVRRRKMRLVGVDR